MHDVRLFAAADNGAVVDQFAMGYWVAALSFGVSVLGAVVGLACVLHAARSSRFRLVWVTSAAVALGGVGVWLSTSVALLGLDFSGTAARFDVGKMIAAMVTSFVAVFVALIIIGRRLQLARLIPGGLVMGFGIGLTLYLGLGSIRIQGSIDISPWLAAVAMAVAVLTGVGTLWSFQALHGLLARAATVLLFAVGVAGMYYAGAAAIDASIDTTAKAPDGLTLFEFVFPMFVVGSLALTVPISAVLIAPDRRETAAALEAKRRSELRSDRLRSDLQSVR
ncbi:MHYT domain-containing protein [Nocardia sp. CA-135953]|uniref:MHYT domain-containing protein n=1 Tax=Nocardia sp. CA-135953 TaxID=3239978 RepID=UPI003D96D3EC